MEKLNYIDLKNKIESGIHWLDATGIIVENKMPYKTKKFIVDTVVGIAVVDADGMSKVDYCKLELAKNLMLAGEYTNIPVADVFVSTEETDEATGEVVVLQKEVCSDEIIDLLEMNGILESIKTAISSDDLAFIERNIQLALEQEIAINNRVEGLIAKFLTTMVERIPDAKEMQKILKNAPAMLEKFDPETAKNLSAIIGQAQSEVPATRRKRK